MPPLRGTLEISPSTVTIQDCEIAYKKVFKRYEYGSIETKPKQINPYES